MGCKVLVTSTSPDSLNHNSSIRAYLYEGFAEVEGVSEKAQCPLEIAADVIGAFRPDIIIGVGSLAIDDADLRRLYEAAKRIGARLAFWLHDDPYEFDYAFKAVGIADHIFTNDRWSLPHYKGVSASHLPMAASKRVHLRPLTRTQDKATDLFFCGVAFQNRIDLLSRAGDALKRWVVDVAGAGWPETLPFARNDRLSAADMADLMNDARLTLNIGRVLDIANQRWRLPPSTPGPRTFEAALAGSPQLYFVSGLEIEDYFEPDREIILFDDADEIAETLQRVRREPEVFDILAERAQRHALQNHTYAHRAKTMLDQLSL